jgi:isocitrate/isopropylmalate dehydrogenase
MKINVVPGDGIGPEITDAAMTALGALQKRFGLEIEFTHAESGLVNLRKYGITVRDEDIERAREADGVILGPMSVREYPPVEKGGIGVPAAYRSRLNLYANIRPNYTREGLPAVAKKMDLVFVRENLEDFYIDRNMYRGIGEFMPTPDVVMAMGKITVQGSRRIAKVAFDLARRRPRRKVTVVHKMPVLKLYNGLFVREAMEMAKGYPDVQVEDMMVDAAAAMLIRTPERFDVVLTTNMFGDILSDEAAELAGSLGLAASVNHGDETVVAQAGHGSAPDIAGKDVANPTSMIQSVAMMLDHIGMKAGDRRLEEAAFCLKNAVDSLLASPTTRTRDLGGDLGTRAFAVEVAKRIG